MQRVDRILGEVEPPSVFLEKRREQLLHLTMSPKVVAHDATLAILMAVAHRLEITVLKRKYCFYVVITGMRNFRGLQD